MPLFEKDIMQRYPALTGGRVWKENHDKALLQAVLKYGIPSSSLSVTLSSSLLTIVKDHCCYG